MIQTYSAPLSAVSAPMFTYEPFINLRQSKEKITCLSISRSGHYITLGTGQHIVVWNADTGKQYLPKLVTNQPSSIDWVDNVAFVVGHKDGLLYTFSILDQEKVSSAIN